MAANFNNSAWFYDLLSRLVYGKALINAQVYLLKFIPPGSRILIVGGGTGWILKEISKLNLSGLQIVYAEMSVKMMALSQKRNTGNSQVSFINDAIENVKLPADFDVIFTPFLLDNFTEQNLNTVFGHIHTLLKPNGIWLNSSFQLSGKWWQRALLKSMYLFFKITCRIEASQLPGIEKQFEQHKYRSVAQKAFYNDFIISKIYEKSPLK